MSLGRRRFLQGSVSTGAVLLAAPTGLLASPAGPVPAPAWPVAAADRPILLLRSPDDGPFARAVGRTLQRCGISTSRLLSLTGKIVGTPGALHAALDAHRGTTLVGLLDDQGATLLEEAVRDLGGSVCCRGQHRGLLHAGTASRHAFTTVASTRGIGAALAGWLGADPAPFLVREHDLCADGAAASGANSLPDAPWPDALGTAYALMALGRWTPQPVVAELRRGSIADAAGSQPYVSLIAKI